MMVWECVLSTADMIVRHGFPSPAFGRRTRSFCSGGRRMGTILVEAPFGGMVNSKFQSRDVSYAIARAVSILEIPLKSTLEFWR